MKHFPTFFRYGVLCLIILCSYTASHAQDNLALNRPVFASSAHDSVPEYAVDGNSLTAWQSDYTDTEWIFVDLGASYPIDHVHLTWDTAYGKDYQVQVSDDTENWITIQTVAGNTSLSNDLTDLSATGRYVRIYGTARGAVSGTLSGFYLSEFEVYSYPDPPSVNLTSPANNTNYTYTGSPAITATADAVASSGKNITKVEFYSENTLLAMDTSYPYAVELSGISDGTHTITARATDDANAVAISAPMTITITGLSVADPCSAPAWSSTTTYSNAGVAVTYLGRAYQNRYYTVGQNPLTNSGQYQVWQLVSTCNTGTSVTITSPPQNDTLAALASVDVHVDALANSPYRVTKVDLYSNTTLIDTDTTASFSFNWNNVAAGNYALTAVATDNAGVTTTSSAVNVVVIAGTGCNAPAWTSGTIYSAVGEQVTYQGRVYSNKWYSVGQNPGSNSGTYQVWTLVSVCPATAVITSPSSGASYTAPGAINIIATASNPAGPVTRVEFYQGSVKLATDSVAPYTYAWSGVAAGTYSLSVKAYGSAGVVAVSLPVSVSVQALQGIYTWTGNAGTYDWNTAGNWSPNGIPGTNDSVSIVSAANYPRLANNMTVTDLTVMSDSLDLNGKQLTATAEVKFSGGRVSNGTLNIQCSEVKFTGTVFTSDVILNATCSNIYLSGSVFNGPVSFTKQGSVATDNDGAGNNIFNGPVTLMNNTTYRLRTGNAMADNYNSNATFNNNSTGTLDVSYNASTPFAGNIIVNSNSVVTFGAGTGAIVLDSNNTQIIDKTGLENINFNRLVVNKSGNAVTLFDPLNINTSLTLMHGNIISASDDKLIFRTGSTVSGANNTSYVSGPVTRYGTGAFTFPVGKGNFYRPIGIAPTGSPSDAFTAEYFNAAPPYPNSMDVSINHISQCEYWTLDRALGNGVTPVTLSWAGNSCGITNPSALLVVHESGGMWYSYGNGGTTGNNAAGTVVSATSASSFSPFTLASSSSANPLPVKWISFTALREQARVQLRWSIAAETGSHTFEVQRSDDGITYTVIGTVTGPDAGSVNAFSSYDNDPLPRISFYRIRQIDATGSSSYSQTVVVTFSSTGSAMRLTPNPVLDKATLTISQPLPNCMIELSDGAGRIVSRQFRGMSSSGTIDLNFSGYARGLYILTVKTPERVLYQERIMKQ